MPLLGFGTWQLSGEVAVTATAAALAVGYRHLDTATVYRNEGEVGEGLTRSGVAREDVFVTTKLPPHHGQELETLRQSLDMLGTEWVDLWLIHWTPDEGVGDDVWRAFITARDEGLARDIGVSNYSLAQINELVERTGVRPAVNQIEWSPLLFDRETLEGHRERDIVLEGYSALKGGALEHPVVTEVAERLGRTPAQVVIRWHLEHGVVVIPKSQDPQRIAANADVDDFELSTDDVAALDALGR
jgi:diketogulonate reductase-like aldo/keto reductase